MSQEQNIRDLLVPNVGEGTLVIKGHQNNVMDVPFNAMAYWNNHNLERIIK
jgi:hypothetical protein